MLIMLNTKVSYDFGCPVLVAYKNRVVVFPSMELVEMIHPPTKDHIVVFPYVKFTNCFSKDFTVVFFSVKLPTTSLGLNSSLVEIYPTTYYKIYSYITEHIPSILLYFSSLS